MAKTALITGASAGIGWELAKQFAVHGIDMVLVARNEQKLQQLAAELKKTFGVQVSVVPKDLSAPGAAQEVFDFCKSGSIPVDYLVNNAGIGYFGMFASGSWEAQEQMIRLNITALTQLTHLFLPGMIHRQQGRVLNVASTAAFQPGPVMAVYFATKSYVLHFSEAIANELSKTGVTVTALCPGPTESSFKEAAGMQESALFRGKKLPTAQEVAAYGYRAMMQGKPVAIHGTLNYLLATSVRLVPRNLMVRIARKITE